MKGIVLKINSRVWALVLLASVCFGSTAMASNRSQGSAAVQHQLVKKKVRQTAAAKLALLPYFGVSENMILADDPQQSRNVANLGKAAGFDFWRLNDYYQLSRDMAEHNISPTQPAQLCNAARALVGAGIKNLMLTFMPTDHYGYPQLLNGAIGQGQADLDELNGFIDQNLDVLFGVAPNLGCARTADGQPALTLWVQAGNEMNIGTFCQPQNDSDHRACAQIAVLMQASVYNFIKGTETPKFGVNITVVGASVASHHTPWVYLQEYQHKQAILTHCVCMDVFDFHPYAQWGSCDQLSGVNMYKALLVNGRAAFGKMFGGPKLPIIYGEWAVQTLMLTSQGYLNYESPSCQVVNENRQIEAWQQVVPAVQQQQVVGLINEHLCDEQDLLTGFQSGLWTFGCQRPKQTESAIAQLIRSAHVQDTPAGNAPQSSPPGER